MMAASNAEEAPPLKLKLATEGRPLAATWSLTQSKAEMLEATRSVSAAYNHRPLSAVGTHMSE